MSIHYVRCLTGCGASYARETSAFYAGRFAPLEVVYQQIQRWVRARCFETMVEYLRMLLREYAGRKPQPTVMIIIDSRTVQSNRGQLQRAALMQDFSGQLLSLINHESGILVAVHSFLRSRWGCVTFSFYAPVRVDNLLKLHS